LAGDLIDFAGAVGVLLLDRRLEFVDRAGDLVHGVGVLFHQVTHHAMRSSKERCMEVIWSCMTCIWVWSWRISLLTAKEGVVARAAPRIKNAILSFVMITAHVKEFCPVGKLFRPSEADLIFAFTHGSCGALSLNAASRLKTPLKPKEGLSGAPGLTAIDAATTRYFSLLLVDEVAARFCCQQSSVLSVQNGFSLP